MNGSHVARDVAVRLVFVLCGATAGLVRAGDAPPSEPTRFANVGSAGCADCHGSTTSRSAAVWKRSYWLWSEQDRHRRAFEALFAPRSVAIVSRLLEADLRMTPEVRDRTLSDESAYLSTLVERCTGCHATTPPGEARQAKDYAAGVSCESCHGAAERWQAAHHGADWSQLTARDKLERFGFAPTRPTAARAAVCVDCHVGPRQEGSRRYDVDHELIAAGHPRLSFEFTSAFARLAPHWDTARDTNVPVRDSSRSMNSLIRDSSRSMNFPVRDSAPLDHDLAANRAAGATRYEARHATSLDTHFEAWRHGQAHVARALVALQDADLARHGRLDFARIDCFACHHRLRDKPAAAPAPRTLDAVALRNTPAGLFGARTLAGDGTFSAWLAAGRFPLEPPTVAVPPPKLDSPAEILAAMIDAVISPEARRWDRLVALDLALRAHLADDDPQRSPDVAQIARQLDAWLAACFDRERPNRYDSPTKFRPDDPALGELLARLRQALRPDEPLRGTAPPSTRTTR